MITRQLVIAAGVAAAFLAIAAGLKYAQGLGLIESETARRATQIVLGLGLAVYANFMPKQLCLARVSPVAEMRSQTALRVGGWSFALAGLIYAALWAFAPLPLADDLSMVVLVGAVVLTLAYAVWAYLACRRPVDIAR